MDRSFSDISSSCKQAIIVSRGGDTQKGLNIASAAIYQAKQLGTQEAMLVALNAMSICQAAISRYIESASTAIDCHALAARLGDRNMILQAVATLLNASVFLLEDGAVTTQMVDSVLHEIEQRNDITLAVRLRSTRAIVCGLLNRFDEGHATLERALADVPNTDRSTPAALIIGNMAYLKVLGVRRTRQKPEDFVDARDFVIRAHRVAIDEQSIEAQIRAFYNEGLLELALGNLDQAHSAFRVGRELAIQHKHVVRALEMCMNLGKVEARQGRSEAAIASLELAFAEVDGLRPSEKLHQIRDLLADEYQRRGETHAAAHERALAENERAEYERECAAARKVLRALWVQGVDGCLRALVAHPHA